MSLVSLTRQNYDTITKSYDTVSVGLTEPCTAQSGHWRVAEHLRDIYSQHVSLQTKCIVSRHPFHYQNELVTNHVLLRPLRTLIEVCD